MYLDLREQCCLLLCHTPINLEILIVLNVFHFLLSTVHYYHFYFQDAQDAYLEQQREITLTRKILVIQKMVRSWHYRRRYLKMRKCIVVVQSTLRAFQERKRFVVVSSI